MNYSKVDPGPPDWTIAIYAFIMIAVVLFAWKALPSPSRPTWSLNGRRQRRR
jgi:hypothetical protein